MSRCGEPFTPIRSAQPSASSKRELSSPLSPEDLLIKRNKYLTSDTENTMDHESEATSVEIENIMPSLHRDILSAIRDDLKSIVKDAVTEAIDDNLRTLKADNAKLSKENKALKKRVNKLETAMDDAEQYSRRNCLRISNVPEDTSEDTDKLVIDVARAVRADISQSDIDRSHRLGKPGKRPTRDIIVKFTSYRAREKLMTKRGDLKRSMRFNGVYVNEDLTQIRSKLLFEARRSVKCNRLLGAWSSDGRILVKNKKEKISRITCSNDIVKAIQKGESETDLGSDTDDAADSDVGE